MGYSYTELTAALWEIVDHARDVRVRWERVPAFADHLRALQLQKEITVPPWADPAKYPDEFPQVNDLDTIQLFLVMIAQGYQHYLKDELGQPTNWAVVINDARHEGVHAQYACAMRALANGMNILDCQYLQNMSLQDVERFYLDEEYGRATLSDLPGRLARFQEVGRVLKEKFNGRAANLFAQAQGLLFAPDGTGIVQTLVREFPLSYGDWPFCKLSMTPARMLDDRRQPFIPTSPEYLALTVIQDPEHFEAGADVARPFVLIRLGILEISPHLARVLREVEPVGRTASEYAEARAAAMLVCRELVRLSGISSPEIGGELWATGYYRCPICRPQISDAELLCRHKSVCAAYQGDYALYDLAPMAGTGD
ncbi:MAG TPA: queuosine salvage family protein [Anaerolineae bacterium]|nr:queuosine salvage family protein [Anaerolineae bacterium]